MVQTGPARHSSRSGALVSMSNVVHGCAEMHASGMRSRERTIHTCPLRNIVHALAAACEKRESSGLTDLAPRHRTGSAGALHVLGLRVNGWQRGRGPGCSSTQAMPSSSRSMASDFVTARAPACSGRGRNGHNRHMGQAGEGRHPQISVELERWLLYMCIVTRCMNLHVCWRRRAADDRKACRPPKQRGGAGELCGAVLGATDVQRGLGRAVGVRVAGRVVADAPHLR